MTTTRLLRVSCPYCGKLAVKASPGSVLEVRCRACNAVFGGKVTPRARPADTENGGDSQPGAPP